MNPPPQMQSAGGEPVEVVNSIEFQPNQEEEKLVD